MPKPWCSKHPDMWRQEIQPFRESLLLSILRCFREVPCDTKPPCPVVYNYKPSLRLNSTPDVSLLGACSIASILPLPSPWLNGEAQSQWLRRLPVILPPLVLLLLQCEREMLWEQRRKQRLVSEMLSSWSSISSPPLDRLREGLHPGPHPQWLLPECSHSRKGLLRRRLHSVTPASTPERKSDFANKEHTSSHTDTVVTWKGVLSSHVFQILQLMGMQSPFISSPFISNHTHVTKGLGQKDGIYQHASLGRVGRWLGQASCSRRPSHTGECV